MSGAFPLKASPVTERKLLIPLSVPSWTTFPVTKPVEGSNTWSTMRVMPYRNDASTRPLLVGSLVVDGTTFKIHCHVQPRGEEMVRDLAFRDALRAAPELVKAYAELKTEIVAGGYNQSYQYTYRKQAWIADVHRRLGVRRRPIGPPATIGILGGGQLGTLARELEGWCEKKAYRTVVLRGVVPGVTP